MGFKPNVSGLTCEVFSYTCIDHNLYISRSLVRAIDQVDINSLHHLQLEVVNEIWLGFKMLVSDNRPVSQ